MGRFCRDFSCTAQVCLGMSQVSSVDHLRDRRPAVVEQMSVASNDYESVASDEWPDADGRSDAGSAVTADYESAEWPEGDGRSDAGSRGGIYDPGGR